MGPALLSVGNIVLGLFTPRFLPASRTRVFMTLALAVFNLISFPHLQLITELIGF